jgi:hypothetical protein
MSSFSQSTWLQIKYPQSKILGKSVKSYHDEQIDFNLSDDDLTNPKIDTAVSADELTEFNTHYKNFITKFFSSKKYTLKEISAKRVLIQTLNFNSVVKMNINSQYVFAGMTADSVDILLSVKKEIRMDYSKVIKDVAGLLTGKVSSVTSKVLPLLDSVKSESRDSITYRVRLANKEVFFLCKIVKLTDGPHDLGRFYKLFFKDVRVQYDSQRDATKQEQKSRQLELEENKNGFFSLIYSPLGENNKSMSLVPEFWGQDNKNVRVWLLTKADGNDLKLYVGYNKGQMVNEEHYYEIQPTTFKGKKYWNLDSHFLFSYFFKNLTKFVYVTVKAEQESDTSIKIYKTFNRLNPASYIKYPDVRLEYLTSK